MCFTDGVHGNTINAQTRFSKEASSLTGKTGYFVSLVFPFHSVQNLQKH